MMKILSRKRLLIALLITTAVLISACVSSEADPTGQEPSATDAPAATQPSVGSFDEQPPEATLRIDGETQISGIGSYCWPGVEGEFSVCADAVGIPTAQEPLPADGSLIARFELPLPDPPDEVQLNVIRVMGEDEMDETAGGYRWWQPKPGDQFQLPLETQPQIELPLAEGLYLFSVFSRWGEIGDVTYGFLVEVGSSQEAGYQVLATDVTSVVTLQDEVTLYNGPGENYEPVVTTFSGLTWTVTGMSADGNWWQLNCADASVDSVSECWISADPSVTTSAEPPSEDPSSDGIIALPTHVEYARVLADAGLNLRTGPDPSYEVIKVVPSSEMVPVTGVSADGGWWRVRCVDGFTGDCWISADLAYSEPTQASDFSLHGLVHWPVDQQLQLWVVQADGQSSLLLDGARAVVSPDGRLAVSCCYSSENFDLLTLIDLETGEERKLTESSGRFTHSPQWWPGNPELIIFISQNAAGPRQPEGPGIGYLAAASIDGSGYQILDDERALLAPPSPAPDGQTIAYSGGDEADLEADTLTPWLYNLETGAEPFDYAAFGLEDIPRLSFGAPAWSPDGKRLAWVVGGDLTGDSTWKVGFVIFDLESRGVQLLNPYAPANQPEIASSFSAPVWSPDGTWLAWNGFPADSLPGFWVLRSDGSEGFFVADGGGPVWSPDNHLLAFNKPTTILVMEVDRWQAQPSGIPDGSLVVNWVSLEE